MAETLHLCLNCNKEIKIGRADRKFCNELCKNEYHNAEKLKAREEIASIDLALRRNRRLLKKVLGGKTEEIIGRETLEKMGFNFEYHTHHVRSKVKGYEYIFCYNYGYRDAGAGNVKVVKSFK